MAHMHSAGATCGRRCCHVAPAAALHLALHIIVLVLAPVHCAAPRPLQLPPGECPSGPEPSPQAAQLPCDLFNSTSPPAEVWRLWLQNPSLDQWTLELVADNTYKCKVAGGDMMPVRLEKPVHDQVRSAAPPPPLPPVISSPSLASYAIVMLVPCTLLDSFWWPFPAARVWARVLVIVSRPTRLGMCRR